MTVSTFLAEVGMGNIAGAKTFSITARKDTVSTSELDDITEIPSTQIVPSPGGIQLEVLSSSDNDGGGTNAGIDSVDIHYLDGSDLEAEETVSLDGQTPVNTVATDIKTVQWMHAKTLGSGQVAVGNITLRTVGGGGTDFEYITAGGNQSLSGRYKVPSGKTGYVYGWQTSGISQKMDIRLRATVERFDRTLIPGVFLFQDIFLAKDSASGWIPFHSWLKMPALAEIKISGLSFTATGDAGGQFDILLIDD